MKKLILLLIFIIGISVLIFILQRTRAENKITVISPSPVKENIESSVTVLAENLRIPWSLNFLPDGRIIFTERGGRIKILNIDTKEPASPASTRGELKTISEINDVEHVGEGGLLGLTLHPDFAQNNFIYIYYTYQKQGELFNQVVRYKLNNDNLSDRKVILDNIPAARNHDGGRIKFGPDKNLYITTGDALDPDSAQDIESLSGKILRVKDDGSVPSDNPFPDSPVFSLGHRNPQGIAWDNNNNMWSTEHGPNAQDELNKIEPGKNYGWPIVTGKNNQENLESPILSSGQDTWAPTGIVFLPAGRQGFENSLYFGGLRGEGIYKVSDLENNSKLEKFFDKEFGRIRDIIVGPDNMFYLIVNNTDGRGNPKPNDDKIIKLNPSLFKY